MKQTVLVLSDNERDCRAISEAALSLAARPIVCSSAAEAEASIKKRRPLLFFCDATMSEGGGLLRRLRGKLPPVVLIVNHSIGQGLLRSCKNRVSDYITTPVLREAAAARIKLIMRLHDLEDGRARSISVLEGWLQRLEAMTASFDPLLLDENSFQHALAARIVRRKNVDVDMPTHILFGRSASGQSIVCDFYAAAPSGVEIVRKSIIVPECGLFLLMTSGDGPFFTNYFDRGRRLKDFRALFPPEILDVVGTIYNFAGFNVSGNYVVALNYGRPVTRADALFLKGLRLPDRFIVHISNELKSLSGSFLEAARALALAADAHNDNGMHVKRMNEYARTMAESMGLPSRLINAISYSAQLHDVGKIYIHPDVLFKPLRLTQHEYEAIKRHPMLGARMLGDAPYLQVARSIALTHHECWDGTGYPAGLSGSSIPIEGAIVKLADVYDALRSMHAYKKAYSHEDTCRLILEGGGDDFHEIRPSHFNPDVLNAFRRVAPRFEEIYQCSGS